MNQQVEESWPPLVGERIVLLQDPKAVVDVMLGIIAVSSGTRTMEKLVYSMPKSQPYQIRRRYG